MNETNEGREPVYPDYILMADGKMLSAHEPVQSELINYTEQPQGGPDEVRPFKTGEFFSIALPLAAFTVASLAYSKRKR